MYTRIIAASLAATIAMPAAALTITERFTSYYAFGDSLTDDGKFGALFPPSLEGRFSNGRTYAEYLADEFTAANLDTGNLALGGATGGDVNTRPLGPLATFEGQITAFSNALEFGLGLPTSADFSTTQSAAPTPGSKPLVSVLFGGNDFFQGFDMIAAADAVADGIRDIAALSDGQFTNFFVMDLPDIGGSPAFADPAASAFATGATDAFNAQLALNLIDLRTEGLSIVAFDSSQVFDDILAGILANEQPNGLLSTGACTANLAEPGPSCLDIGIDPNTLAFSDGVHPSGPVHEILGQAVVTRVAAIPLPATAPLALFALAGMGWVGRRRKAA
jgi:phospholipase/lecithinase/hemolysin